MANLASITLSGAQGHVVVMAHNKERFSDDEWEAHYLRQIRELKVLGGFDTCANLVFAEGQGPTSKQRNIGNKIFGDQKEYRFRVAVVTSSMLVRGAVTAIAWFNPLISAYKPTEWRAAVGLVRLGEQDLPALQKVLADLKKKVPDCESLNVAAAELDSQLRSASATR